MDFRIADTFTYSLARLAGGLSSDNADGISVKVINHLSDAVMKVFKV
jgi:hypothetical protein